MQRSEVDVPFKQPGGEVGRVGAADRVDGVLQLDIEEGNFAVRVGEPFFRRHAPSDQTSDGGASEPHDLPPNVIELRRDWPDG